MPFSNKVMRLEKCPALLFHNPRPLWPSDLPFLSELLQYHIDYIVVYIKCPVGEGHWSQGVLSKNVCHKPLSIGDIKADATAADVKTPQQTLKGPLIRLKNIFSQFLPYRWNCSFDFMRFMVVDSVQHPSSPLSALHQRVACLSIIRSKQSGM